MSGIEQWSVGDRRVFVHRFTQEEVDSFARLTGDVNPLHVDSAYARRTPLGGPVVHGMLAASFVSNLIGMQIPGPGALWNSFAVNWRRPVRIGDELRFEVVVAAVHRSTGTLALQVTGTSLPSGEVCLEGNAGVVVMSAEPEKATATGSSSVEEAGPMKGRRIVVTGASGEVGRAISLELACRGATVVPWGRDQEKLGLLLEQLGPHADTCCSADLSDSNSIERALARVVETGGVSGLVHAAAAQLAFVPVDDPRNIHQMREHWLVEVAGLQLLASGLVPHMSGGGAIVAVLTTSILDIPPTKMSAYVSAKLAAWGLIKSMAVELGPRGIRCNAVSPGMMNTPYSRDFPIRVKQVEAASNPLRRLCTVEDVARAVAFLCGPEADFINGVNLTVSGGGRMPC